MSGSKNKAGVLMAAHLDHILVETMEPVLDSVLDQSAGQSSANTLVSKKQTRLNLSRKLESIATIAVRQSAEAIFLPHTTRHPKWRLNTIQSALAAIALVMVPQWACAADTDLEFNASFLSISGNQPTADLSVFSKRNVVLPGIYSVDIYINENFKERRDIRFSKDDNGKEVTACITRKMLSRWGVNLAAFPAIPAKVKTDAANTMGANGTASADNATNIPDEQCIDISTLIPAANVTYDAGQFRLDVSVPQAAMRRVARGTVNPKLWNTGITAGLLDYQINMGHSDGDSRNTVFAGLRSGVNVGDWRARTFSTFSPNRNGRGGWQTVNAYGQRDITSLKSQLVVGDGSSPGDIFDGVQFRGVQMQTDEAMLPNSQRGYAPTIRGVAQTAAKVAVRQNGYIIYTTYVAPGPFVIDDLYSTSGSGDLEVTITEADGRETKFIQPFAALPVMMRDGAWRYSATAGKYRSGYSGSTPVFVQATVTRGLPAGVTVYGGANISTIYGSVLVGTGINLHSFGAYSIDVAHARTQANGGSEYRGSSIRFRYAKSFASSGTNFSVLGYRYSTRGYRTFAEAAQLQDMAPGYALYNQRSRMEGTVSQRIGTDSAMYFTAGQQSYWGRRAKDNTVRLSYNSRFRQINYGVYLDYNTYDGGRSNKQISVSLSMPLGGKDGYVGYGASRNDQGNLVQNASYTGSAFDDSRLTYGVYADKSTDGGMSGSGTMTYLSPVARFDASRSQGRGYGQTSMSVTGGVVAHADGVTLSQSLGETVAVVNVPGGKGIPIEGYAGIETDAAGNAVIPYISPYNKNRIALRTEELGNDIEIANAVQDVIPRRGAVVLARFEARVGHRVLFELTDANGRSLPLGARVEDDDGRELGIVGPDGQAYVTGLENEGSLTVKWSKKPNQQCQVPYAIDGNVTESSAFKEITAKCNITEEI